MTFKTSWTESVLKPEQDESRSFNGPQISAGLGGLNDLFENQKKFYWSILSHLQNELWIENTKSRLTNGLYW